MTVDLLIPFARGLIDLTIGYFVARLASKLTHRLLQLQRKPRYVLLAKKAVFYIIFVLFILSAAREWGLNLSIILGATGIITVALSLASQTVVSNFISGLFLLGEDTLRLGEKIKIDNIEGEIIEVKLFSITIEQKDGTIVRIPNDLLLKTPVSNLTSNSNSNLKD